LHPSDIALSPANRILELAELIGEAETARWCAGLLDGSTRHDDRGRPPMTWLGGRHAAGLLRREDFEARGQDYWPRVWAARGLMYVWRPDAEVAILTGLRDPAWRVREVCAKVARRRGLVAAERRLERLLDDPNHRVRVAAEAALAELERRLG